MKPHHPRGIQALALVNVTVGVGSVPRHRKPLRNVHCSLRIEASVGLHVAALACITSAVTFCCVMFYGISSRELSAVWRFGFWFWGSGTAHPSGFGVHRWKKAAGAHDWQKRHARAR